MGNPLCDTCVALSSNTACEDKRKQVTSVLGGEKAGPVLPRRVTLGVWTENGTGNKQHLQTQSKHARRKYPERTRRSVTCHYIMLYNLWCICKAKRSTGSRFLHMHTVVNILCLPHTYSHTRPNPVLLMGWHSPWPEREELKKNTTHRLFYSHRKKL